MAKLSARLEMILQLVQPCALLADVGTDHGMIPATAVQRGIAQRAIAADLRVQPLLGARRYIERAGVGDRVAVVLGDGFAPLVSQAVDAAVLAGMSGSLMVRLCDAAPQVLAQVKQLIVQPNQEAPLMRAWALRNGWHLRDERMIKERERFFISCAFEKRNGVDPAYQMVGWTAAALCNVGPLFLTRKDPVALKWCEAQYARLLSWVNEGVLTAADEMFEFEAALALMR